MHNLNYPLQFKFQIGSIANDFVATDSYGKTIFYVREKIFTWRDKIHVYSDKSKTDLLYTFTSNKLIDFQQTFTIANAEDDILGKVRRKTIRSLWRSTFNLLDAHDVQDHTIKEKNVWTKFWDSLLGEIPVIGVLSGYFFHPSYILRNNAGEELFELKKEPSFFGRKFSVHRKSTANFSDERFLLALMLVVLNERRQG